MCASGEDAGEGYQVDHLQGLPHLPHGQTRSCAGIGRTGALGLCKPLVLVRAIAAVPAPPRPLLLAAHCGTGAGLAAFRGRDPRFSPPAYTICNSPMRSSRDMLMSHTSGPSLMRSRSDSSGECSEGPDATSDEHDDAGQHVLLDSMDMYCSDSELGICDVLARMELGEEHECMQMQMQRQPTGISTQADASCSACTAAGKAECQAAASALCRNISPAAVPATQHAVSSHMHTDTHAAAAMALASQPSSHTAALAHGTAAAHSTGNSSCKDKRPTKHTPAKCGLTKEQLMSAAGLGLGLGLHTFGLAGTAPSAAESAHGAGVAQPRDVHGPGPPCNKDAAAGAVAVTSPSALAVNAAVSAERYMPVSEQGAIVAYSSSKSDASKASNCNCTHCDGSNAAGEHLTAFASAIAAAKLGLSEQLSSAISTCKAVVSSRDTEGRTALHYAAGYGHDQCVDLLLSNGADVCVRDATGEVPLHFAAIHGYPMCVYNITKVSPSCCLVHNARGQTPVEVAVACERGEVLNAMLLACAGDAAAGTAVQAMKQLLRDGAVPDTWAPNGSSALMLAAAANNPEALAVLLQAGASLELQDALGRSALMFAAGNSAQEALAALLDAGACIAQRDRRGRSVLDYAPEGSAARTTLSARLAALEVVAAERQRALLDSLLAEETGGGGRAGGREDKVKKKAPAVKKAADRAAKAPAGPSACKMPKVSACTASVKGHSCLSSVSTSSSSNCSGQAQPPQQQQQQVVVGQLQAGQPPPVTKGEADTQARPTPAAAAAGMVSNAWFRKDEGEAPWHTVSSKAVKKASPAAGPPLLQLSTAGSHPLSAEGISAHVAAGKGHLQATHGSAGSKGGKAGLQSAAPTPAHAGGSGGMMTHGSFGSGGSRQRHGSNASLSSMASLASSGAASSSGHSTYYAYQPNTPTTSATNAAAHAHILTAAGVPSAPVAVGFKAALLQGAGSTDSSIGSTTGVGSVDDLSPFLARTASTAAASAGKLNYVSAITAQHCTSAGPGSSSSCSSSTSAQLGVWPLSMAGAAAAAAAEPAPTCTQGPVACAAPAVAASAAAIAEVPFVPLATASATLTLTGVGAAPTSAPGKKVSSRCSSDTGAAVTLMRKNAVHDTASSQAQEPASRLSLPKAVPDGAADGEEPATAATELHKALGYKVAPKLRSVPASAIEAESDVSTSMPRRAQAAEVVAPSNTLTHARPAIQTCEEASTSTSSIPTAKGSVSVGTATSASLARHDACTSTADAPSYLQAEVARLRVEHERAKRALRKAEARGRDELCAALQDASLHEDEAVESALSQERLRITTQLLALGMNPALVLAIISPNPVPIDALLAAAACAPINAPQAAAAAAAGLATIQSSSTATAVAGLPAAGSLGAPAAAEVPGGDMTTLLSSLLGLSGFVNPDLDEGSSASVSLAAAESAADRSMHANASQICGTQSSGFQPLVKAGKAGQQQQEQAVACKAGHRQKMSWDGGLTQGPAEGSDMATFLAYPATTGSTSSGVQLAAAHGAAAVVANGKASKQQQQGAQPPALPPAANQSRKQKVQAGSKPSQQQQLQQGPQQTSAQHARAQSAGAAAPATGSAGDANAPPTLARGRTTGSVLVTLPASLGPGCESSPRAPTIATMVSAPLSAPPKCAAAGSSTAAGSVLAGSSSGRPSACAGSAVTAAGGGRPASASELWHSSHYRPCLGNMPHMQQPHAQRHSFNFQPSLAASACTDGAAGTHMQQQQPGNSNSASGMFGGGRGFFGSLSAISQPTAAISSSAPAAAAAGPGSLIARLRLGMVPDLAAAHQAVAGFLTASSGTPNILSPACGMSDVDEDWEDELPLVGDITSALVMSDDDDVHAAGLDASIGPYISAHQSAAHAAVITGASNGPAGAGGMPSRIRAASPSLEPPGQLQTAASLCAWGAQMMAQECLTLATAAAVSSGGDPAADGQQQLMPSAAATLAAGATTKSRPIDMDPDAFVGAYGALFAMDDAGMGAGVGAGSGVSSSSNHQPLFTSPATSYGSPSMPMSGFFGSGGFPLPATEGANERAGMPSASGVEPSSSAGNMGGNMQMDTTPWGSLAPLLQGVRGQGLGDVTPGSSLGSNCMDAAIPSAVLQVAASHRSFDAAPGLARNSSYSSNLGSCMQASASRPPTPIGSLVVTHGSHLQPLGPTVSRQQQQHDASCSSLDAWSSGSVSEHGGVDMGDGSEFSSMGSTGASGSGGMTSGSGELNYTTSTAAARQEGSREALSTIFSSSSEGDGSRSASCCSAGNPSSGMTFLPDANASPAGGVNLRKSTSSNNSSSLAVLSPLHAVRFGNGSAPSLFNTSPLAHLTGFDGAFMGGLRDEFAGNTSSFCMPAGMTHGAAVHHAAGSVMPSVQAREEAQ